jgi:hypothetical protein
MEPQNIFPKVAMLQLVLTYIGTSKMDNTNNSFKKFTYSHVHTLFGSLLPPAPLPPPSPTTHFPFQAEPVLHLSLILLKRKHKHNKKDKAFLLVEIKIVIQRDF